MSRSVFKLIRKEAIVILLMASFFSYSQEINFRRVENAHVIDAITKDTISSHSSDAEAKQELLNWKFKNREVFMIGAIYEVDIKNMVTQPVSLPEPIIEIDTIIGKILSELDDTNKSSVHIDYSRAGTEIHSPEYYVSLKGLKLFMPIITDTIEPWLSLIELKRTKTIGETKLERIGTPFQQKTVYVESFNNIYRFRVETTEFCQSYFVMKRADMNEIIYSNMEFSFNYENHGINISDLDPGTEYEIRNHSINEQGNEIISNPIFFTVPEVEEKPLLGFNYYVVYTLYVYANSVKVRTWTTEDCSIQLELGIEPYDLSDYPTDTGINASHPNSYYQHGRLFENLLPDTIYYWRATNVNINGVSIKSSIHSFKTLSE